MLLVQALERPHDDEWRNKLRGYEENVYMLLVQALERPHDDEWRNELRGDIHGVSATNGDAPAQYP